MLTNACESDPCKALPVCGNTTYTVAPSYTSSVASNPIGTCSGISPAGTTFAYASNWMYVRFTCTTTGSLVFTLNALDPGLIWTGPCGILLPRDVLSLGVGNLVECNSRGRVPPEHRSVRL
ncbi:MAG: hypothetical protein HWD58_07385 [Bacteroidota bacterium]|nr:MAG: hypothetical protein HWD58_07385 [Bacteroidota bacterium]